jgi:hypothetical protein
MPHSLSPPGLYWQGEAYGVATLDAEWPKADGQLSAIKRAEADIHLYSGEALRRPAERSTFHAGRLIQQAYDETARTDPGVGPSRPGAPR